MRKFVLPIAVFLLSANEACLAQANLVMKNGDGQIVGWVMHKFIDSAFGGKPHFQVMTPDGYFILFNRHYHMAARSHVPDKIYFTSAGCIGTAWVPYNNGDFDTGWNAANLTYEIFQLDGEVSSDWFVRVQPLNQQHGKTAISYRGADGICTEIRGGWSFTGREAFVVNPNELGLTKISDIWLVHGVDLGIDRPNVISCSGFESCPSN